MPHNLDEISVKIMECLQKNARMAPASISREVHISPSAVTKRISRLEKRGYILNYTTVLDKVKVNKGLSAFVTVSLNPGTASERSIFSVVQETFPEIVQCYFVNGDYDYLLHISVSDMEEFKVVHNRLTLATNSIATLKSVFVIKEERVNATLDLKNLYTRFLKSN